jgi:hypothetical protein
MASNVTFAGGAQFINNSVGHSDHLNETYGSGGAVYV